MYKMPYASLERGAIMVATPEIESGLFFRSVVILCEHNPTGTFGLVINKSLEVELPEEIINISQLSNPRVGIRAGGPVQTNQMMLLHNREEEAQQLLELCSNVYLGGDLQFLQSAITDEEGPEIMLCFGYAGWGAGQLEKEFLSGSWLLLPGRANYVFSADPTKLWAQLLRELGGKYASMSLIPEDLSLN